MWRPCCSFLCFYGCVTSRCAVSCVACRVCECVRVGLLMLCCPIRWSCCSQRIKTWEKKNRIASCPVFNICTCAARRTTALPACLCLCIASQRLPLPAEQQNWSLCMSQIFSTQHWRRFVHLSQQKNFKVAELAMCKYSVTIWLYLHRTGTEALNWTCGLITEGMVGFGCLDWSRED